MIGGYSTSCPCPGPCDRCGRLIERWHQKCPNCSSRKPARSLVAVLIPARRKPASSKVVWRRAA